MFKNILALSILMLLLVQCDPLCTAHRVKEATLRDSLFSVEQTENGCYRVFMIHDDVCGYCTTDQEMGKFILNTLYQHSGEVLISFRDLKSGDPEKSWWDQSDCGSVTTVGGDQMTMFMLKDVRVVYNPECPHCQDTKEPRWFHSGAR